MPAGKDVVDIGCGGGIYSPWDCSARRPIGDRRGQDRSRCRRSELRRNARRRDHISDGAMRALPTRPDASADIVFERAVIHHLSEAQLARNAVEARRLLRAGGSFVVQDRTIEDVESGRSAALDSSTLFEVFPRLIEFERRRRPIRQRYSDRLTDTGFREVRELDTTKCGEGMHRSTTCALRFAQGRARASCSSSRTPSSTGILRAARRQGARS